MKKNNIAFVVSNNLCTKCGMCYSICPENAIEIKGDIDKLPVINDACTYCKLCLKTCPGISPIHDLKESLLGNYLSCYIGYSSDDDIRFSASSGGIITSLNISLLEDLKFDGIICIRQSLHNIFENEVILATTRDEVLSACGSRYAPAYACRGLKDLPINKNGRYAFVGKPCDIQALIKFQKYNKGYNFFKVAIFCAHTPSMNGTREIITSSDDLDKNIVKFDYRGQGWPGYFTAYSRNNKVVLQKKYEDIWGSVLCKTKYYNKRCLLCHDCTGENADLSVGDAWLDEYIGNSSGHSVIISRSEESEKIINRIVNNNAIVLEKVDETKVILSQKSLLNKKNNLYIKKIVSRMIFEKVPEEKIYFMSSNNDVKKFPGIFKYFLKIKLINMIEKYRKRIKLRM